MTDHTPNTNRPPSPFREECAFVQENLEAEALDILEPVEHARMQRHLQLCGPCRREVADLRRVADMLPLLAEPATPSPMVKARLFQQIADESEPGPRVVSFGDPWSDDTADGSVHGSNGSVSRSPGTPAWRSWAMSAMVAPLAIALIILAAWSNSLSNDLQSARSGDGRDTAGEIAVTTGATDMRLYAMESSCPTCDDTPATGHLGGNLDDNVGILVAWNLNPDEQHEVWCENRDGQLIRVSDLQVQQSGQVAQTVSFPDAIGAYTTIYVTRLDGTEEMRVALGEDTATPEDQTTGGE